MLLPVGDLGHLRLGRIQPVGALVHRAVDVAEDHVAEAHLQDHLGNGNARGSGAVDDDFQFAHFLAHHLDGVEQRRGNHNGRAVLVVMENRNVAALL